MTDFWSSHLHVPAIHDLGWCYRNQYDAVIRRMALVAGGGVKAGYHVT